MSLRSLFRRKPIRPESASPSGLARTLGLRDLTFFGIAAIIGAGSFSSMGQACASGGPGVVLLFALCAIACGFTALCYAEFAARVQGGGSAYAYAYVTFGELFAWTIGWALIMEYSIGNIYVAFSWSGYFTNLLDAFGVHLPEWLTINYRSAHKSALAGLVNEGSTAWASAPMIGGLRLIFDLPAVLINVVITYLVLVGVRESRNVSNAMVWMKLAVILLVILVGAGHVDLANWSPFLPNGFGGVMAGASAVFFAYIGFDAISTLAEESKDPQRHLPRSMVLSLVVCTSAYIALALVLTGMVPSAKLNVADPLAEVFQLTGVKWMLLLVSVAAVVAMTSVMLVFQLGQPRIWMSMSRDGLLPKRFSRIHPRYNTPGFSTMVTGLVVGVPIFFTSEEFILDFTSIGTLFAFVLVCGGVLLLPRRPREGKGFHLPYINGRYVVPAIGAIALAAVVHFDPPHFQRLLGRTGSPLNLPMLLFYLVCAVVALCTAWKNWSLIPVLGLLSCCYLLTGMAPSNWAWFGLWLLIGLVCYFAYGYRRSTLASQDPPAS
jgi:basic amino acid/polyamine antiporter, APA family